MSFLAPQFLWVGLIASAATAALHFLVTRQPKSQAFPTARFVPQTSVETVARAPRPSDLLVLLLRILAIASVTFAFAQPVLSSNRNARASIILADVSRSSSNLSEVRDSVRKYFAPKDIVIAFDSSARPVLDPDSIPNASKRGLVGNLSAAIVAAIGAAPKLRDRADSISLIVVSSLPAQAWDAATDTVRSLWPGSIKVVNVSPPALVESTPTTPIGSELKAEDPLRYALTLASKSPHAAHVVIVSSGKAPQAVDSNQVVLHWPESDRPVFAVGSAPSPHGALVAGPAVVIGNFKSHWAFPEDSIRGALIIARWEDGTPAAVQRNVGSGCVRSTNIPVIAKGDMVIRPEFVAVVRQLISPCEATEAFAPASRAAIARLTGGTAAAPRSAFALSESNHSSTNAWFLVAALVFLVGEQATRRRGRKEQPVTGSTFRVAA